MRSCKELVTVTHRHQVTCTKRVYSVHELKFTMLTHITIQFALQTAYISTKYVLYYCVYYRLIFELEYYFTCAVMLGIKSMYEDDFLLYCIRSEIKLQCVLHGCYFSELYVFMHASL